MSPEWSVFLQVWGGLFYLLNKIFLSRKERTEGSVSRLWNIAAWSVYIVGLPAWLVILAYEDDWMVTLVELGGLPSMVLGLVLAMRHLDELPSEKNRRLTRRLKLVAGWVAIAGIAVSIYHLGFMTRLSQWLELGVTIGFLVGTYRLAEDHLDGYGWFFLMNFSCGVLMIEQQYFWLGVQQVLSLGFVIDAYFCKKAKLAREEARTTAVVTDGVI